MYTNNYPFNIIPYSQPQQQNNGINWVQGMAGAKSYLVAPGQSALLMDSEESVFYIKSSDPSGMPMPLRIFEYKEKTAPAQEEQPNYITREEFEKRLKELTDGKPTVPAA